MLPAAALALVASGCSADGDGTAPAGHSHGDGQAIVSLPVGDGTESERVGYALEDVSLPARAGATGDVAFRVTYQGEPVTHYIEELTRDLHLYVVSEDLTTFRHLHPAMADDGTWTAPVQLPASGDYRVVAEFVARDSGGNGDHLVLGRSVEVPGGAAAYDAPADPVIEVDATQAPVAGSNGRMELRVRDTDGEPVRLGTYLGAFGHVTGFHEETGSMVHVHPLDAPSVTEDGSTLTFHTEIEQPGDYRLFVQVRVDGYLHTVPVEVTVGSAPA
ncbi:hypothetical protein GCM10009623_10190 [Nocardioides aestuarii]